MPTDKSLYSTLCVCLFGCLFGWRPQASSPKCTYLLSDTYKTHTRRHYTQPICSPADLQIAAVAQVQLAPLQSTVEHILCLCFLYHPIKIFPLMVSLLQVGDRTWIMNSRYLSSYCPSKCSRNHSDSSCCKPSIGSHEFNAE